MRAKRKVYDSRKSLLYQIHEGKKFLALKDYEYEALVEGVTGETSCGKVRDTALLADVVAAMKKRGWPGLSPMRSKLGEAPAWARECRDMGGKIKAILLDTEKTWNYAHGIAEKMYGKRLDALSASECNAVLTALIRHQAASAKKSAQRRTAA